MSTGFGLFFGLIFCGLVFLYTKSNNQAAWRRALRYGSLSFISLVVVVYSYVIIDDLLRNKDVSLGSSKPISPVTEMDGMRLGEKLSDVRFRLGFEHIDVWRYNVIMQKIKEIERNGKIVPQEDKDELAEAKNGFEKYQASVSKDGDYIYSTGDWIQKGVKIKNGIVVELIVDCEHIEVNGLNVNGVSCGDRGESIISRFGNDVRVSCVRDKEGKQDDFVRRYYVVKYGASYRLDKNVVTWMYVEKPEALEIARIIPCN